MWSKNEYLVEIEVEDAHPEGEAPSGDASGRRRPPDDPDHEPPAPAHSPAERLDGPEPAGGGGGGRGRVAREEVGPAEEAEEEGHDGVGNLLGAAGVDVDQAETKVCGEGGIDGPVGGAEAENELPGAEAALGGAGEEGEGVDEDGGGGLDPAVSEAGEADVLDGSDAGEDLLL